MFTCGNLIAIQHRSSMSVIPCTQQADTASCSMLAHALSGQHAARVSLGHRRCCSSNDTDKHDGWCHVGSCAGGVRPHFLPGVRARVHSGGRHLCRVPRLRPPPHRLPHTGAPLPPPLSPPAPHPTSPTLACLHSLQRVRVVFDLYARSWDVQLWGECPSCRCLSIRVQRMIQMYPQMLRLMCSVGM